MIYSLFFLSVSLEFIFFLERAENYQGKQRWQNFAFRNWSKEECTDSWCNCLVIITVHFFSIKLRVISIPFIPSMQWKWLCQQTGTQISRMNIKICVSYLMQTVLSPLHLSSFCSIFCQNNLHATQTQLNFCGIRSSHSIGNVIRYIRFCMV